jgi:hypothetical protein
VSVSTDQGATAGFDMRGDRLIGKFSEKVTAPVVLKPGRIECVESTLKHGVGHGPQQFKGRASKTANRTEYFIDHVQGSRVAPHNGTHFPVVKVLWEGRAGGDVEKYEQAADIFRSGKCEVAKETHRIPQTKNSIKRRPRTLMRG